MKSEIFTKVNFFITSSLNLPFCQVFSSNAVYSQKGHPFSCALGTGPKVSNCPCIKMLSKSLSEA